MMEKSWDEDDLVLRAKDGERAAFDELYQRYKRPMINYLYRFIGNFGEAEELAQEVFVRAYINIGRFEPRAKFSSWLYRIASNLAKNHFRRFKYEKRLLPGKITSSGERESGPGLIDMIEDDSRKPDESAQQAETRGMVQEAIGKLPSQFREAVILCDIEGFSYDEAADIMGCSAMTVGSRIWRARDRLAKLLSHIKNGDIR